METPDGSKLEILLLGSPEVRLGSQQLNIQRRLLRLLLYYLALQRAPVTRIALVTIFWPNESEDAGRKHLRETLSRLRSELLDPDLLVTHHDLVSLDFSRVYVDVQEYWSLVEPASASASGLAPAVSPELQYTNLQKAFSLWRSTRFMAGLSFPNGEEVELWFTGMSQEVERSRQQTLLSLADLAFNFIDPDASIHWLRAGLEVDPLDTDFQYRLLYALYTLNHKTEAVNYCNYLDRLYQDEGLGDLPPSISQLSAKVLDETPAPAIRRRSIWTSEAGMLLPFVGQKKPAIQLKLAFQNGGAVAVLGEAGSGKSRLVHELYQNLNPRPRLLTITGKPMETHLPFQPIIEALRRIPTPEEWRSLNITWAAQLVTLLPDLPLTLPSLKPGANISTPDNRTALYEAIYQMALILARGQRILLLVDDAQWIDDSTLAVISYLIEKEFFPHKGLLVLTARLEEISPALDRILNAIQPVQFTKIFMESLNMAEVKELADYGLGCQISDALAQRLLQDTGGNPLFLVETMRTLLEYTFTPDGIANLTSLPLASSIHSLVRNRLQRLHPQTREVLYISSILGREFPMRLLELASGLSIEEVTTALEELEKTHLLRPIPEIPGQYQFIHEKIREVIILELSQARKRLLHLRAAKAIEQVSGRNPQQAGVLARHFESAGEQDRAFTAWLEAGHYARQFLSRNEAYSAYRRAESILKHADFEITDSMIHRLYASWGSLADELGDAETMRHTYRAMLQFGEQRHSPLLMGSAYSGMAKTLVYDSQIEPALRMIDYALPFLQQCNHPLELMECYNRCGMLRMLRNEYSLAVENYRSVIQAVPSDPSFEITNALIQARNQLGRIYLMQAEANKAVELAQGTVREADRWRIPVGIANAYSVAAKAHLYIGDYKKSMDLIDSALPYAEQIQNPSNLSMLYLTRAQNNLALGRLDAAWADSLQTQKIAAQMKGGGTILCDALIIQSDMMMYMRRPDESRIYLEKALKLTGDTLQGLKYRCKYAVTLGMTQSVQSGLDLLYKIMSEIAHLEIKMAEMGVLFSLTYLHLMNGDLEAAAVQYQRFMDANIQCEYSEMRISFEWLHQIMLLSAGAAGQAEAGIEKLLLDARACQNFWYELFALQLKIICRRRQGLSTRDEEVQITALLHCATEQATTAPVRSIYECFSAGILNDPQNLGAKIKIQ